MTLYKYVNGVPVELTSDEIDEYNQRQIDWEAGAGQRLIDECTKYLEQHIIDTVAEKNYSSGVSCASYKDSTNAQWASEATTFIAWRDACYLYAFDYLARSQSGEISSPNINDFMAGLPAIVWP